MSKPSVSARTQRERAVRAIHADIETEVQMAASAIFNWAVPRIAAVSPHSRSNVVARKINEAMARGMDARMADRIDD